MTTTITTATVLDTITELASRPATGTVFDRMATLDQLTAAFDIKVDDDGNGDFESFRQLLAALRELEANGAIVQGAVAAAAAVYAPAGSTVPQEW